MVVVGLGHTASLPALPAASTDSTASAASNQRAELRDIQHFLSPRGNREQIHTRSIAPKKFQVIFIITSDYGRKVVFNFFYVDERQEHICMYIVHCAMCNVHIRI